MEQLKENTKGKFFRLKPKSTSPATDAVKRRRHWPHWLPYGLAGFGITILLAFAFRPAPLVVDVGRVTQGPLQVTIDAEGKTRVKDRYVVAAPVAGRLQRITLEAGDPVSANAIVAQIDPLPLDTQVHTAKARLQQLRAELAGVETQRPKPEELLQAEARLRSVTAAQQAAAAAVVQKRVALEQARRDRLRAQELEAEGAISRQEREASELAETRLTQELVASQQALKGAIADITAAQETLPLLRAQQRDPDYLVDSYRAQIAGVEAELANLADEARRAIITAPSASTVLRVPKASARFVSAGEPLLELGNPAELELVIDVLSADAVKIEPGDPILVEQWGGPVPLTAIVSYLEPSAFTEVSALGVEEQRINVIGIFTTPATVALGDGYRIESRIVIWADDNVLQVPISALDPCGEHWCVFVVEAGRALRREITIGQRSRTAAVVKSGLQPEEQVILHPSEQIEAGRNVKPR